MIPETSEQMRKRFLELNVNIKLPEIKRRLSDLTERFNFPIAETKQNVVSYFLQERKLKREDYCGMPQGAASKHMRDGAQAPPASRVLFQFDIFDRSLQDHERIC